MVKETQKLKAAAETRKIESSSAPEPPKSREEKKVSAPSQTNITMQLLQKALITRDQLKKAKQYQKSMGTGKSIEEILVLLGSLSQESLDEFMQSQ
jgi:threonine aldolase